MVTTPDKFYLFFWLLTGEPLVGRFWLRGSATRSASPHATQHYLICSRSLLLWIVPVKVHTPAPSPPLRAPRSPLPSPLSPLPPPPPYKTLSNRHTHSHPPVFSRTCCKSIALSIIEYIAAVAKVKNLSRVARLLESPTLNTPLFPLFSALELDDKVAGSSTQLVFYNGQSDGGNGFKTVSPVSCAKTYTGESFSLCVSKLSSLFHPSRSTTTLLPPLALASLSATTVFLWLSTFLCAKFESPLDVLLLLTIPHNKFITGSDVRLKSRSEISPSNSW